MNKCTPLISHMNGMLIINKCAAYVLHKASLVCVAHMQVRTEHYLSAFAPQFSLVLSGTQSGKEGGNMSGKEKITKTILLRPPSASCLVSSLDSIQLAVLEIDTTLKFEIKFKGFLFRQLYLTGFCKRR